MPFHKDFKSALVALLRLANQCPLIQLSISGAISRAGQMTAWNFRMSFASSWTVGGQKRSTLAPADRTTRKRRQRSTRRRRDSPALPRLPVARRTVGRAYTDPDGRTRRPAEMTTPGACVTRRPCTATTDQRDPWCSAGRSLWAL